MRKNVIFAVIAVMASLDSCQKENAVVEPRSEEQIFTATIENTGTKTTINADNSSSDKGKIYWSENDEITIKDKDEKAVVYVAQSYGSTTTTFKKKVTEPAQGNLGEGPYTATYGTAPSTSQSYSDYYSAEKEAKDLYMIAPSTATRSFTFTAACGLMKINLTASTGESDKTISEIKVFGKVNSSDVIYTLTCSSAQSISSSKDFFIALPAGSYTVFKFTNSTGHICYKTAKSAIAIADNGIQPVTLTGIVFNDMLPGKFTVNSSSKQVRFSRGNLYYSATDNKYHTEEAQYVTYITLDPTSSSYTSSHVCHFFWSKSASVAYAEEYEGEASVEDVFFCGEDKSLTINGQSGLYALTGGDDGEWNYLFSSRANASDLYKYGVRVTTSAGEVRACVVIAPDGYTGTIASTYDAAAWATAESNGLVCLPAAGYRDTGSSPWNANEQGYYWSATPYDDIEAYQLNFNGGQVLPSSSCFCERACSIRLVSTVTK